MNKLFENIYREAIYDDTEDNQELRELFNKYNTEYFNGELSIDKICWAKRKTTRRLGAFFPQLSMIVINPIIKDHINEPLFKDVLVHEMVHDKLDGIDSGHGKYFLDEAEKLNKKFGLHITATADNGSDIGSIVDEYIAEQDKKRNDKLNNISNKPELQEIYDMLNEKYFDNKLTNDLTIEYLPKKTWNTYSLGQQRRNEDEWIWYIKVNRNDTEKAMLPAMIYMYCYDIIKPPKKEMNNVVKKTTQEIAEKFGLDFLKVQ